MKNVLVTGGLRGIGHSVVDILNAEGYKVYAIYNSSENKVEVNKERYPNIEMLKSDLSSRESIYTLVNSVKNISFFALINVAGMATAENIHTLDISSWDKTFEVNVVAPILLSQQISSQIEQGGSIINISSTYGALWGMNMSVSYSASKAALSNVTKTLAYQLKDKRIRVNAVAPSIVDTDMTAQDTKEMLSEVSRRTPVGRIAKPEEIANIVSFLISDKASYINGQTIIADGGYSCWDGIY